MISRFGAKHSSEQRTRLRMVRQRNHGFFGYHSPEIQGRTPREDITIKAGGMQRILDTPSGNNSDRCFSSVRRTVEAQSLATDPPYNNFCGLRGLREKPTIYCEHYKIRPGYHSSSQKFSYDDDTEAGTATVSR